MAQGIPVQSILDQGHWARESTFARFYKRTVPSNNDDVGQAVFFKTGMIVLTKNRKDTHSVIFSSLL